MVPSPQHRKLRLVRAADIPDDALVVLRAAPGDSGRTLRNLVDDAADSAATYVVLGANREREILHGVSVFAQRSGVSVSDVLIRFPMSPFVLEMSVGDLRRAGFALWATGANPDHYDVQLVPGRVEGVNPPASAKELRGAAGRFMVVARSLTPNPRYAGGVTSGPEDRLP